MHYETYNIRRNKKEKRSGSGQGRGENNEIWIKNKKHKGMYILK